MSNIVKLRRAGFNIRLLDEDFSRQSLDALLPEPDKLFNGATILKPGSRTHAGVVDILGRKVVLKRYNDRGVIARILDVFRRARAWHAWRVAYALKKVGVPVARPLVFLEERHCRLLYRSYVLMEYVERSESLTKFWDQADKDVRLKVLRKVGDMFGRMHAAGLLHGDLKWGNILISSVNEHQVTFVDFDGGVLIRFLARIRMQRDLNRFLRDLDARTDDPEYRKILLSSWSAHTSTNL